MAGENQGGMQCAEFDALLSDILDGRLTGPKRESFQAHARVCGVCGPLLADAEAGQQWLKSLQAIEPPAELVNNILIATTGLASARAQKPANAVTSWKDALAGWLRPVFGPMWAMARQPRFAMSFGMVFFSLSVTLSMAGIKMRDLSRVDLRPSAIKRTYYETSGRVVKYYENIRFVYEVESRVRELKRVTAPVQEPAPEEKQKKQKNDTSGRPDQKQERNYSQEENGPVLADFTNDPPVVLGTTYRRHS